MFSPNKSQQPFGGEQTCRLFTVRTGRLQGCRTVSSGWNRHSLIFIFQTVIEVKCYSVWLHVLFSWVLFGSVHIFIVRMQIRLATLLTTPLVIVNKTIRFNHLYFIYLLCICLLFTVDILTMYVMSNASNVKNI